jgi:outer membrane protein assembly factor BamD (BamD/ComL family)
MKWNRLCAAPVLVCGLAMAITASAQDMSFGLEETGQSGAPVKLGKPSKQLSEALSAFEQKKYEDAAMGFERSAAGKSKDGKGNRQRAQFLLGQSLYKMGYYQSALTVFDDISAQGPAHIDFGATLQWLGMLASKLPESSGIIEKVGRYGIGALEEFKEKDSGLYNQLLYLMGRHLYDQTSFRQAIDVFQEVDPKSAQYTYAKFFEGISFIRMRQARPAIASFRAILEAIDAGDVKGVDEDRMRNLAWISLARVYYTAANQGKGGQIDGTLLGQSVESWTKIDQSSEYWLESLFESSWAFFLADEYSRALGNVHTLYSPYFEDSFYPEALVLKAVTFFVNCQVDNAEATVAQFHDRYDPVKNELDVVLQKHQDNADFFEFLKQVRANQADLSPRVRPIVSSALSDRTVLRHLEYVQILDKEEARLGKASQAFQSAPIGEKILEDVSLARAFAVDQAGDLARGRYNRLIRELRDLSNQVDTVELEIATFRRGQIDQELQQQMSLAKQSRGGDVKVDEEHQLWPFNGEWWRDELGFYRQQVTNLCTR